MLVNISMFNEDQPTIIEPRSRIIVIGDVHGDLGRLTQTLYNLKIITPAFKWIAEPADTIIVQMGDQVDSRQRDAQDASWEVIPDVEVLYFFDKLDRIARAHGGRALSIIGNHEFMNTIGLFDYVSENSRDKTYYRAEKFAPGGMIASEILAKRNLVLKIGDILFVHGGFLKNHLNLSSGNLLKINETARKFFRGQELDVIENTWIHAFMYDDNGLLWTREYMAKSADQLELNSVLSDLGCSRVIVGHNTVNSISIKGPVCFTDAMFSRAYGREGEPVEVLEISNNNEMKIIYIYADAKK